MKTRCVEKVFSRSFKYFKIFYSCFTFVGSETKSRKNLLKPR